MRRLEELQAAILDERDVAPRELDLERAAVMAGAKQHRLLAQRHTRLAAGEDALDHVADLAAVVAHRDQDGLLARGPLREQVLRETLLCQADHRVGGGEDRLGRAVVLLERRDRRRRLEASREIQDVAHARGAKAEDRLGVVADHRHAAAVRLHLEDDRGLQRVGVLILVDQHVVEPRRDVGGQRRQRHQLLPVEQQVVVIEHALALLGLDIAREQGFELGLPVAAPGEGLAQDHIQALLRVDRIGVDRKAGGLPGEPAILLAQALLVAHEVDQVGGIAAIEHGEAGIEADLLGIEPEQAGADRVERARPQGSAVGDRGAVADLLADLLGAAGHRLGGAAREGQQQHAARIGAVQDQVCHPVRERVGLARAGAGDDQKGRARLQPALGRHAESHGGALCRIQGAVM